MRALALRQPWCWMTVHAGKDVENRVRSSSVWRTKYRGPLLLHASKAKSWREEQEYYDAARWWLDLRGIRLELPPARELDRGVICGVAHLEYVIPPCLDADLRAAGAAPCSRRWHMHEQHGLVLRDARPTRALVDCRGALGLFAPPPHVLEALGLR